MSFILVAKHFVGIGLGSCLEGSNLLQLQCYSHILRLELWRQQLWRQQGRQGEPVFVVYKTTFIQLWPYLPYQFHLC